MKKVIVLLFLISNFLINEGWCQFLSNDSSDTVRFRFDKKRNIQSRNIISDDGVSVGYFYDNRQLKSYQEDMPENKKANEKLTYWIIETKDINAQ